MIRGSDVRLDIPPSGGAPALPGGHTGPLIRPLTKHEQEIRQKYAARVDAREREARAALAALATAREVLHDLALAFHGGGGPVVMTEDGLYEVADG